MLPLINTGCKTDVNSEKINKAETLIMSHPDSALLILESIEKETLKKDKDRARFGLLYTMALDKNFMKPQNDSLINYSVKYFTKKQDKLQQLKSEYYRGRVLYHHEEYSKAMVNFLKTKEIAEQEEKDFYWAAMACRGISDIYLKYANYQDNLEYSKKALEYFRKSGEQPYLNYSLLDLASAFNNNSLSEQSLTVLEEVLDSAKKYRDDYLYHEALHLKGVNLIWTNREKESISLFETLYRYPHSKTEDSLYYCLSLIQNGKPLEARRLLSGISDSDRPYKDYIRYRLYRTIGNNDSALYELEKYHNSANNYLRHSIDLNNSNEITEYFELNRIIDKEKIRVQKLSILLILFSIFLLLLLFIIIFMRLKRKYVDNIEQKVILAEELEESLTNSERLSDKSKKLARELLEKQYNFIKETGEILYRNSDQSKAKKQISDKVTCMIEGLSLFGGNFSNIEEQVNKVYDNLVTDFRTTFPTLKDQDYGVFVYSVLGFPASMITLLLKEEKIESVYNRKRNLKNRIKNSNSPDKERFLSFL